MIAARIVVGPWLLSSSRGASASRRVCRSVAGSRSATIGGHGAAYVVGEERDVEGGAGLGVVEGETEERSRRAMRS